MSEMVEPPKPTKMGFANADEFERQRKGIETEVRLAMTSIHSYLAVHRMAAANNAIKRGLNEQARFWNVALYSLQSSFFLAMARLFDESKDSLSMHTFLRNLVGSAELFSKSALQARKEPDIGAEEARDYIARRAEITVNHLRELKKSAAAHADWYSKVIRPIRDEAIAHRLAVDDTRRAELYSKTKIDQIEAVLMFLFELETTTWEMLHNGRIAVC
ncbi:MAG: hypothetical protein SFV19_04885 [Rhodospirillaceae bacterium]|nr:hypothetical protein [Rhodospirillaceae bacterium]